LFWLQNTEEAQKTAKIETAAQSKKNNRCRKCTNYNFSVEGMVCAVGCAKFKKN
jgi:hypothetical protein